MTKQKKQINKEKKEEMERKAALSVVPIKSQRHNNKIGRSGCEYQVVVLSRVNLGLSDKKIVTRVEVQLVKVRQPGGKFGKATNGRIKRIK